MCEICDELDKFTGDVSEAFEGIISMALIKGGDAERLTIVKALSVMLEQVSKKEDTKKENVLVSLVNIINIIEDRQERKAKKEAVH